jgi:hypothetical protein
MNLSSNDDDLFDYDPQQDLKTSINSNVSSPEEDNSFSIDDLSFSINTSEAFYAITSIASKFFSTEEILDNSFKISVSQILDEMTHGKFSKNILFHSLEKDIIKRKALITFNQLFVHILNTKTSESKFSIFQRSDIQLDVNLLNTMVQSSMAINFHIVETDTVIYTKISEELGFSCNSLVFKDYLINSFEVDEIINANVDYNLFQEYINSLGIHSYLSSLIDSYREIYSNLLTDEVLDQLKIDDVRPFLC